jgi:hypothetical protein
MVTPAVALFLQYFEELSRRELLGWRLYGILSKEFLKHTQVDTQTARLSVRVAPVSWRQLMPDYFADGIPAHAHRRRDRPARITSDQDALSNAFPLSNIGVHGERAFPE